MARQRSAGGQGQLALGLDSGVVSALGPGPLQILSTRMAPFWDALCVAYDQLGFAGALEADEVFRLLVLARII